MIMKEKNMIEYLQINNNKIQDLNHNNNISSNNKVNLNKEHKDQLIQMLNFIMILERKHKILMKMTFKE